MLKRNELADPNSCLNKAADDEPVFVIRGKDPAAASAISRWINKRVELGLNQYTDSKIIDAQNQAFIMAEYEHKKHVEGQQAPQ